MSRTTVILVHGLWMVSPVMGYLGRAFRRLGHSTVTFGYASRGHDLDYNAALLNRRIAAVPSASIAIVAHSYGGVVSLRALNLSPNPRVQRVVLLGSPVAGSAAGRSLAQSRPWRLALGRTASVWEEGPAVSVPRETAVGAIAGARPRGLSRFVTRLDGDNDGVVRIAETKIPGLADHLTMATSHSTMLVADDVARQAEYFIRHGRFSR